MRVRGTDQAAITIIRKGLPQEVVTDGVREASRARAPDSTMAGERRSANGPARRRRLRSRLPGPRRDA